MDKLKYFSPVLLSLDEVDDDPTIVVGLSGKQTGDGNGVSSNSKSLNFNVLDN